MKEYIIASIIASTPIIAAFIAKKKIVEPPETSLRTQIMPWLFAFAVLLFLICFPVFTFANIANNIIRTTEKIGNIVHQERGDFALEIGDYVEESEQAITLCIMGHQNPNSSCTNFYKKVLKQAANDENVYIALFKTPDREKGYITSENRRNDKRLTTEEFRDYIKDIVKEKEKSSKYEGLDGQVELLLLILHKSYLFDDMLSDVKKDHLNLSPYDKVAVIAGVIGEILFE